VAGKKKKEKKHAEHAGLKMFFDYFNLAFKNLKSRKTRSFLTVLGIFIGIVAVVALISIGQGMQNAISAQFESLGKDKIIIRSDIMGSPGSASKSLMLTDKDLEAIKKTRGISDAAGFLIKSGVIKFKGEQKATYIYGFDPGDKKILGSILPEPIEGRNLKQDDGYKAVVGYDHAYGDKLWEKPVKIGDSIEIENKSFRVVGIMDKIGNSIDDSMVAIKKDAMKEVFDTGDEESEILAKVDSGFNPTDVAESVKKELRRERGEEEGQETFSVQTSEQLLKTFSNIFGIVQAVLIGIAAISLLVGGIGIMNTMYTSVLERTREIGIMKSIGAKNSDIFMIFFMEAGMLGLVGGLAGAAIGIGISKTVEIIAKNAGISLLQVAMPLWLILGALAFSIAVGCLSGTLPAMRASRLKPVEALRYE